MVIEVRGSYLYVGNVRASDLAESFGTPLFVYDGDTVASNYSKLARSFTYRDVEILYSCKANSNPGVLSILRDLGAGVDASSPQEVLLSIMLGFPKEKIMFTGNGVTDEEMKYVRGELGVLVNVDSISQLRRYGRLFPDTETSIRVNPGFGYGYHEFTTTGGLTKFGIGLDSLDRALEIAREYRLKVVGLHSHIGSGIFAVEPYTRVTKLLLNLAKNLPDVEFVDIGGGMGIPQKPGDGEFNHVEFGQVISELVEEYSKSFSSIKLRIEPGRFIVGNAGVLLTRVVEVKEVSQSGARRIFVIVDSSVNHLIRSVLMDVYYEAVAVSKASSPREVEVDIVGNLCMAGDVLAKARKMPRLEEGDVLAFMNAGAYTYSMSLNYNMKPRPAEVIVYKGRVRLTRRRESFTDLIATLEF
ncbi:MAG: diaminopimelate decarboxylase [Sulfolobales archaeon]|nr:diaminopimelate decarboxylase [Sulfolobales archaeon]MDW8082713.1 diaminopimelate decarboxylase [Sulfolobales archaeon]